MSYADAPASRNARIVATSRAGLEVTPSSTMDSAAGRQRSMSEISTDGSGGAPDSAPVLPSARLSSLDFAARPLVGVSSIGSMEASAGESVSAAVSLIETIAARRLNDSRHSVACAMATSMAHGHSHAMDSGRPKVTANDRNASKDSTNAHAPSANVITRAHQ